MDAPAELKQRVDVRDYLAAERTLLAWIRTGLALMGFGFVVARFGLFLRQLQIGQHAPAVEAYGLSQWFGTALIGASVVVNLLSGWHHIQLVRTISAGQEEKPHSTSLAVSTSVFLALVGLAMAIYLVSVRGAANAQSENTKEASMAPVAQASGMGIVDRPSNYSVAQIVERLKNILQSKGVTLFALVDHSGEAEKIGMKMRPTKLLIFDSPKAGTPLMLAAPSIAIDLPLKILVWEDHEGKVWISYNSPEYLKQRHNVLQELLANIAVVETLAANAAEQLGKTRLVSSDRRMRVDTPSGGLIHAFALARLAHGESHRRAKPALPFLLLCGSGILARPAHSQIAEEETLGGPDSHETGQGPHGHLFGDWGGK